MAAQKVVEVPVAQAQAFVAGGTLIKEGTYGLRAKGVTVTLKHGSRPGLVKMIIVQGCTC
jgi:hypothetical protein